MAGNNFEYIVDLSKRLKAKCYIEIIQDIYNNKEWRVIIATQDNQFPYWVEFHSPDLTQAIQQLRDYMEGRTKYIKPSGEPDERTPEDFLTQDKAIAQNQAIKQNEQLV